ncbi:MAG TPA: tRNA 5'-guanylyltransferase [Methanomicrobia archaeon]|nr:tRNA 5'-guanylyltransferase [Methanomicrobia archaeon]
MTAQSRIRDDHAEKELELYAAIRALPPLIVRADGRNFRRLLQPEFSKPFDTRFATGMADAVTLFFERSGFDPLLAFLFSDEVNLCFTHVPFRGRLEKLNSVIASYLASALTLVLRFTRPIAFDARVIPICDLDEGLRAYLAHRQAEAWRNHINAYGYYGLQTLGLSKRAAETRVKGMKAMEVHELLYREGINLNETPAWQRRGMIVAKEPYGKQGYDRRAERAVTVTRFRTVQLWELPLFSTEDGQRLLNRLTVRETISKRGAGVV